MKFRGNLKGMVLRDPSDDEKGRSKAPKAKEIDVKPRENMPVSTRLPD